MTLRRSQRGIAAITAILIVAIGTMIAMAPNCCALRGSFTRDEAQTASWRPKSAANGPTMKTSPRERGVSRAVHTSGSANTAINATYTR